MSNQRATWGSLKEVIGRPVGLCADNPDLLDYYNEGVEALWNEGLWLGKTQIWKMRVLGGCRGVRSIVYPREIETLQLMNICGTPIGVRNQTFQFISNALGGGAGGWFDGYGNNYQIGRCGLTLVGDRQEVCTEEDLLEHSRIRVYTQRVETSGEMIVLGYDENGIWVRTQDGEGAWRDGEYLNISNLTGSGVTSTTVFSSVTGIQITNAPRAGQTYLYGVNADSEERLLASYDYAVSIPVFRKSIITGLGNRGNSETDNSVCVTALVSLRFLPVMSDTDYVQISLVSALKEIIHWIYSRDSGKIDEGEAHKQNAINLLNKQLQSFNGFGAKRVINFGPRQLLGASSNMQ